MIHSLWDDLRFYIYESVLNTSYPCCGVYLMRISLLSFFINRNHRLSSSISYKTSFKIFYFTGLPAVCPRARWFPRHSGSFHNNVLSTVSWLQNTRWYALYELNLCPSPRIRCEISWAVCLQIMVTFCNRMVHYLRRLFSWRGVYQNSVLENVLMWRHPV
jgi:hypothetical protein